MPGDDNDFLKDKQCEICGSPAKRINFARILCDKQECLDQAYDERGGPGGHKLGKK